MVKSLNINQEEVAYVVISFLMIPSQIQHDSLLSRPKSQVFLKSLYMVACRSLRGRILDGILAVVAQ